MKYLLLITGIFISLSVSATTKIDLSFGQHHSIKSKFLEGGERNYYINLPSDYSTSKKEYPVLYVLDGQMHFPSAVAIQHSLGTSTDVPEMIIVGIENVYPRRKDLVWRNKETYISFLSQELIPFIDKKYRTKQERILFGWEWGSYFSSYLLLHESQLFSGAISSNGGFVDDELIKSFESIALKKHRYLYLANSIQDIYSIDDTNNAVKALNDRPNQHLVWKSELFNNETHSSLPYLAMFNGLRYFYHNYNSYDFYSIKQYEEFGGIPAIKKYFKERADRFGFLENIDDSTKNTLIWLAWKRDNFEYFDLFMTEFKDVLQTKRYQSEYWQNRLGQYYLKYKKYDQAIIFFNKAKDEFEQTAQIYNGLGRAYLAKKDKELAIENFKMAIDLAIKNSDDKLRDYQSDLNNAVKE
jgi:predicted alpha/beta superfamily hydrolase